MSATSGGPKWAVVAMEKAALSTVSPHTSGVSMAASIYAMVTLVVPVVTPKGVPVT